MKRPPGQIGEDPAALFQSAEIERQVQPMLLSSLPAAVYERLARYGHLLYRWNARMSLTALSPREWFVPHVAECLRAAQRIPVCVETVLDFGSGSGLPGIPMQIARPELRVTLAESQGKKAAFLREAVRELALARAKVLHGRVEELPIAESFDLVTLRAVDRMERALAAAGPRIAPGGWCLVFTSVGERNAVQTALPDLAWEPGEAIPGTEQRILLLGRRLG